MASERAIPKTDPNERDPLAEQLESLRRMTSGHGVLKVDAMFGHRPLVLASIVSAKARGVSSETIAAALSTEGEPIGPSSIDTWIKAQLRRTS